MHGRQGRRRPAGRWPVPVRRRHIQGPHHRGSGSKARWHGDRIAARRRHFPANRLPRKGRRHQLLGVLVRSVPDRDATVRSALSPGQAPGHPVRRDRRQGHPQWRPIIHPGERHQLPHSVGRAGADRTGARQGAVSQPAVHGDRRQTATHRR
jgi:hypothetical protein